MIVCLVTDRRRADPVAQARQAAAAGVDLIQVRERDLEASALAAMVHAIVDAVSGHATRVVVNDRLDVALACGAHGVHLRTDSIPPSQARPLGPPGFLVGRSVHSAAEAAQVAADVDYLIAGTVFITASKPPGHGPLGVGGLRAISRSVRVPVLAIGGVTGERIAELGGSGAAGIAAIGLFSDAIPAPAVIAAWRTAFDSVTPAP
ncbi:MAG TPA: thiamine phosphate synthase [Vicinamibacterales bacterium]|nr:thiamine phosphate synthase [Vicinamibacterales bacterium]